MSAQEPQKEPPPEGSGRWLPLIVSLPLTLLGAAACLLLGEPAQGRAMAVAALCLGLWLGEIVPPFVPTLVLLIGAATVVPGGTLGAALDGMADPVLALFFGGFVLGEAATAHGIDRAVVRSALSLARGQLRWLVAAILGATALLSMWISNIAAAALMLASLKPLLGSLQDRSRRALLVAVAFGANLGGMATPIGTGPNAIALAAIPGSAPSFLAWMAFALPLMVGSLMAAFAMLVLRGLPQGTLSISMASTRPGEHPGRVGVIVGLAVVLWLTEPLHGVSAAVVALGTAAVLFGTGLVPAAQLRSVDWSTLLLIAGGLGLGQLIEDSGLLRGISLAIASSHAPSWLILLGLLLLCATMSALMSNTATAALLIPLASALDPGNRALPILVALAASYGMPFVISTPPNAMAVGAGARAQDLFWPGMALLIGGCFVLATTGPTVLGWFLG